MKTAALVVVVLLLSACDPPGRSPRIKAGAATTTTTLNAPVTARSTNQSRTVGNVEECAPEVDTAVLDVVLRRFAALAGGCTEMDRKELECLSADLKETQGWAEKLGDQCQRDAYLKWLDYYAEDEAACRNEVLTRRGKHGYDADEEKRKKEEAHQRAWERDHQIAKPPKTVPCARPGGDS